MGLKQTHFQLQFCAIYFTRVEIGAKKKERFQLHVNAALGLVYMSLKGSPFQLRFSSRMK